MKPNALTINESDNVAVTLGDVNKGEAVYLQDGRELTAADNIPFSHKIALREFGRGDSIVKYGEIIGQAGEEIREGEWVHTHNLVVEDLE